MALSVTSVLVGGGALASIAAARLISKTFKPPSDNPIRQLTRGDPKVRFTWLHILAMISMQLIAHTFPPLLQFEIVLHTAQILPGAAVSWSPYSASVETFLKASGLSHKTVQNL